MTDDDQAMVRAALAGTRGAFAELVRAHQKLVWHLLARMVPVAEDVRDLSQDTFLKVHQSLHQFRGESRLSTWIGQIAFSIGARHLRKHRIELADASDQLVELDSAAFDTDQDLAQLWDRQHAVQTLQHRIAELTPTQRVVLALYYLEEHSLDEIAKMTALSVGTLKSHLFRARQQLRKALQPEDEPAHGQS
jgi:RNA polymerase sigma factor (sigma-70 family)